MSTITTPTHLSMFIFILICALTIIVFILTGMIVFNINNPQEPARIYICSDDPYEGAVWESRDNATHKLIKGAPYEVTNYGWSFSKVRIFERCMPGVHFLTESGEFFEHSRLIPELDYKVFEDPIDSGENARSKFRSDAEEILELYLLYAEDGEIHSHELGVLLNKYNVMIYPDGPPPDGPPSEMKSAVIKKTF